MFYVMKMKGLEFAARISDSYNENSFLVFINTKNDSITFNQKLPVTLVSINASATFRTAVRHLLQRENSIFNSIQQTGCRLRFQKHI